MSCVLLKVLIDKNPIMFLILSYFLHEGTCSRTGKERLSHSAGEANGSKSSRFSFRLFSQHIKMIKLSYVGGLLIGWIIAQFFSESKFSTPIKDQNLNLEI